MGCQELKKSGIIHALIIIILGSLAAGIGSYFVVQKEEIEPIQKYSKPSKKIEDGTNQTTSLNINTSVITTEYIIDTTTSLTLLQLCSVSNTWSGDLFCDDGGNIAECNFDNGDCCLPIINSLYCIECFCHQDGTQHNFMSQTSTVKINSFNTCSSHIQAYIGDGYCDDTANVPICNFDDGDCCLDPIQDDFCFFCQCYQGNMTSECSTDLFTMVNDGMCQDQSNIEACDWDGGDCCDTEASAYLCHECQCHSGPSLHEEYLFCYTLFEGDGICDDAYNTLGCNLDHGDCCLSKDTNPLAFVFCNECICYDCPYSFVGDGFCDDATNNAMCDYDGGDCCFEHDDPMIWNPCELCICHQNESIVTNMTEIAQIDTTEINLF